MKKILICIAMFLTLTGIARSQSIYYLSDDTKIRVGQPITVTTISVTTADIYVLRVGSAIYVPEIFVSSIAYTVIVGSYTQVDYIWASINPDIKIMGNMDFGGRRIDGCYTITESTRELNLQMSSITALNNWIVVNSTTINQVESNKNWIVLFSSNTDQITKLTNYMSVTASNTVQIITNTNWVAVNSTNIVNWALIGTTSSWTTDGTNIWTNKSGNVGIGTTAPTSKLDINGLIISTSIKSNNYQNVSVTSSSIIQTQTVDGTYTGLYGSTLTVTSLANTDISIIVEMTVYCSTAMGDVQARILYDGTVGFTRAFTSVAQNAKGVMTINYIPDTVTAGTHNICVQMNASEGLATATVGRIRYREIRN